MACTYLHFLPIIVFAWFPFSFTITFTLAVTLGHVNPLFPYISDTGTFSPESCIFGQLISIGVLMLALVMYIRYRQIREVYQNHDLPQEIQKLNYVSVIVGSVGIFGVSVVGNFQETNVISVHIIGAFVGFGLGTVYLVLQTVISYKVFPVTGKMCILYVRLVLSSVCVFTFIICIIFGFLSLHFFKEEKYGIGLSVWDLFTGTDIPSLTKWSRKDGGWEMHIVSTISEWLVAFMTMSFVLTFSPEFRNISLSEPIVHMDETLILPQNERAPSI